MGAIRSQGSELPIFSSRPRAVGPSVGVAILTFLLSPLSPRRGTKRSASVAFGSAEANLSKKTPSSAFQFGTLSVATG